MRNAMLCAKCQKGFNAPWSLRFNRFAISDRCPECLPEYELTDNRWSWVPVMAMPEEFRATEVSRLPQSLQTAVNKDHFVNSKSLLLHGPTGLGKTRAAWKILERWWIANGGPDVTTYTMRRFQNELEESHDKGKHSKLMNVIIETPMLFLDDLGKEKLTPRLAADLFAVVDERSVNRRPCLITTNFNSAGLMERFPDSEMGAAFVRRLKDYYEVVGTA
jgi:DNA replication protein DnaC